MSEVTEVLCGCGVTVDIAHAQSWNGQWMCLACQRDALVEMMDKHMEQIAALRARVAELEQERDEAQAKGKEYYDLFRGALSRNGRYQEAFTRIKISSSLQTAHEIAAAALRGGE